jgi:hypothetical protein
MITKWDELQLRFDVEKFDLPIDDAADDAADRFISPEEARLISEAARQALENLNPERFPMGEDGKRHLPDWVGDYAMLRQQGWPWRVACYIAWAASPKAGRWPATLGELAVTTLGLMSPRVIYTWRRKHASIDTVVAIMQAAPLWEHRRDVLEALVTMAKDPNYKAHNDRKLFLEMIGDYVPRSVLGVGKAGKGNEIGELSDEDLRQWMGEVKEKDESGGMKAEEGKDEGAGNTGGGGMTDEGEGKL